MKKIISLILVALMLIGLVACGTENVDIYEEAESVLYGIGLMLGYPDGFRPNEKMTRAEASKIIISLVHGSESVAANTIGDISDCWAKGYISACVEKGIVQDGKNFRPNDNITIEELEEMLLIVLGYKSNLFFDNNSRSNNITKYAQGSGLSSKINDAGSIQATREKIAQILFNALTANMVQFDDATSGYIAINNPSANAIYNDSIVQLGEYYYNSPQLKLVQNGQKHQWVYNNKVIYQ